MTTNTTTQAEHFSIEFPADSEFFNDHPIDGSTDQDNSLFFDGMEFLDEFEDVMDCSEDEIEPLHLNKEQKVDAIQEDDASYLLSSLKGDQQDDATAVTMNSLSASSSSSISTSAASTTSGDGRQRPITINDQLQTLMASMKRTEESRKHIIAQRQMMSPEQKTMLGMAKEQLKRSRLDFIKGSGLLSSLM